MAPTVPLQGSSQQKLNGWMCMEPLRTRAFQVSAHFDPWIFLLVSNFVSFACMYKQNPIIFKCVLQKPNYDGSLVKSNSSPDLSFCYFYHSNLKRCSRDFWWPTWVCRNFPWHPPHLWFTNHTWCSVKRVAWFAGWCSCKGRSPAKLQVGLWKVVPGKPILGSYRRFLKW